MKLLLTPLLSTLLVGCTAMGNLPTMEYCSDVSYVRTGNQIDIKAHCAAPIKDMALPAPLSSVVK